MTVSEAWEVYKKGVTKADSTEEKEAYTEAIHTMRRVAVPQGYTLCKVDEAIERIKENTDCPLEVFKILKECCV